MAREPRDDAPELVERQLSSERPKGLLLRAFEECEAKPPLALLVPRGRSFRVAGSIHVDILPPTMTVRPASQRVDEEASTALLARLALWLAEVSADATADASAAVGQPAPDPESNAA